MKYRSAEPIASAENLRKLSGYDPLRGFCQRGMIQDELRKCVALLPAIGHGFTNVDLGGQILDCALNVGLVISLKILEIALPLIASPVIGSPLLAGCTCVMVHVASSDAHLLFR